VAAKIREQLNRDGVFGTAGSRRSYFLAQVLDGNIVARPIANAQQAIL
jgi:hypothetical protein